MEPLPLAHMDVMWKADADSALRDGKLEIIACKSIVRRGFSSDAQARVTDAVILSGLMCGADVLSYDRNNSEYTWYGQRVSAEIIFYRRRK